MRSDHARPCRRCLKPLYRGRILGADESLEVEATDLYLQPAEIDDQIVRLGIMPWTFETPRPGDFYARPDGTVGPLHRVHVCEGLAP